MRAVPCCLTDKTLADLMKIASERFLAFAVWSLLRPAGLSRAECAGG